MRFAARLRLVPPGRPVPTYKRMLCAPRWSQTVHLGLLGGAVPKLSGFLFTHTPGASRQPCPLPPAPSRLEKQEENAVLYLGPGPTSGTFLRQGSRQKNGTWGRKGKYRSWSEYKHTAPVGQSGDSSQPCFVYQGPLLSPMR